MEKVYKQVPFDIELAKNILNGKVDGKVGFEFQLADGSAKEIWYAKSIHALNNKTHPYYVIFEWNAQQYVEYMTEKGYLPSQLVSCFIELPEETPKQYPYDRVKDKITDTDWQEAKKTFPDSGNMQSAFISGVAYQICKGIDNKEELPKHEFKPFDKVLVRNGDQFYWCCSVFSHIDYEPINENEIFTCINGATWKCCIPYEGNQELVGTTDKPKEE